MSAKLEAAVRAAAKAGRTALIPYLPYGYPERERFWDEMAQLDASGADVIEIGVPFSDPVADGPVIEQAGQECLERGATLAGLLTDLKARAGKFRAALVLMGYMNPFYRYGLEKLADDAAAAGVSGFIIPDLPYEESEETRAIFGARGLDLVPLIGLNTSPERMALYADDARGFAYFVSVLGTTGERATLPDALKAKLAQARGIFKIPLALGFGIREPAQLAELAGSVDAVVFGSALVRWIGEGHSAGEFMERWK